MSLNVVILGEININSLAQSNSTTECFYDYMPANVFVSNTSTQTRYSPDSNVAPTLLDRKWITFLGGTYNNGLVLLEKTDECPM